MKNLKGLKKLDLELLNFLFLDVFPSEPKILAWYIAEKLYGFIVGLFLEFLNMWQISLAN